MKALVLFDTNKLDVYGNIISDRFDLMKTEWCFEIKRLLAEQAPDIITVCMPTGMMS